MLKLLLMAGAAALITAPATAQSQGKGHGKGHAAAAKAKPVKAKGPMAKTAMSVRTDRNRNGIDDRDESLARKYGGQLCPPGLWAKTPSCVPPGQAKRMFREGQRLSGNYRYYTPYGDIPLSLRNQYNLDDDYRYIYRDNVIYVVDPTTRLVRDVINAVL